MTLPGLDHFEFIIVDVIIMLLTGSLKNCSHKTSFLMVKNKGLGQCNHYCDKLLSAVRLN